MQELRLLLRIGRVGIDNRRRNLRLIRQRLRMFAVVILPRVARDLVHPCAKRSAGFVCLAVLENAKEDVLHQVFARGSIAGEPAIKVEQRNLVAIEQHAEHLSDTFPHLQHEVFVWKRIGHCAMRVSSSSAGSNNVGLTGYSDLRRCHGWLFSSPAEHPSLSQMKTEHGGKGYRV